MEEPSEVTKNLNILNLPSKIIENVFDYVKEDDRRNLSLTCSRFNEIIINKKTYGLTVSDKNVEDRAILVTKRKIIKIKFDFTKSDDMKLKQMTEILKIHGSNISMIIFNLYNNNTFEVHNANATSIFNLFKLMPKVKELELLGPIWHLKSWRNIEPMLENVEKLEIEWHDKQLPQSWIGMLFKPHTISKLIIKRAWENFDKFIAMQSSIKNLEISFSIAHNFNFFTNLQLESLAFFEYVHDHDYIKAETQNDIHQFLLQHPELRAIKKEDCMWKFSFLPQTIQTICAMENLESLQLLVTQEMLSELRQLSRLRNIKDIWFDLDYDEDPEILISITSIRLPTVEKVTLVDDGHRLFNNSLIIDNMTLNWPRLKDLTVYNAYENGIDLLNEFLDKMPQLESLKIFEEPFEDYRIFYFRKTKTQYINLKNLDITAAFVNSLPCLLNCLPNLEVLRLCACPFFHAGIAYNPVILRHLLQQKKLKKLSIQFEFGSRLMHGTQEDVDLLLQLCRQIPLVHITFSEDQFSEDLKEMLRQYIYDSPHSALCLKST